MTILNEEITFSLYCVAVTLGAVAARRFSRCIRHEKSSLKTRSNDTYSELMGAVRDAASIIDEIPDDHPKPMTVCFQTNDMKNDHEGCRSSTLSKGKGGAMDRRPD